MKGHVGGGSGYSRLSGVDVSVKLGRSLLGFVGLSRQIVHMSQYIPLEYIVQEWLLEMSGMYRPYSGWYVSDIKLES
ncbi:hypothetical protein, partial [Sphingobium psychrophilum]|uniref:hypothetical protein n=1 Tax=Sphingobium psychrophilum TaxID=2728834 RepID=UPI00146BB592